MPSENAAAAIVASALRHGIDVFDCARSYGEAEARLGRVMTSRGRPDVEIHTKLAADLDKQGVTDPGGLAALAEASVLRSCLELRVRHLDVLMLHRWGHRWAGGGIVWETLIRLRDEGVIGSLGTSVYEPSHALEALVDPDVKYLQLPFNVLDWRWAAAEVPEALRRRPDVTVEARSVLLQGVLAGSPAIWPVLNSAEAKQYCSILDELVMHLGRQNRADLCYAYVAGTEWIDRTVVGMENVRQVEENVALFGAEPLSREQISRVDLALPKAPEALLDPSLWTRT